MKILGLMGVLLWLGAATAGGAEAWQLFSGSKEWRGTGAWPRPIAVEEPAGKPGGAAAWAEAGESRGDSVGATGGGDGIAARMGVARAAGEAFAACRSRAGRREISGVRQVCEIVAEQHPERGPPAPPTTSMV